MNDYDYFRATEFKPLKIWNQAVMYHNILEDSGKEAALDYAGGLTKEEKVDIFNLVSDIKLRGYETVRAELNRGMKLNGEAV